MIILDTSRLIADGHALVHAARTIVERDHVRLDQGHQYWKGHVPVLGVTETLHKVGIINRQGTEEHMERGTAVHLLAKGMVKDDQHRWPNMEGLAGYGSSLYHWLEEKQPITLATELLVYHSQQNYAGTLDWFGVLDDHLSVLDWKTGAEQSWHAVQTAAYVMAVAASSSPQVRRGSVYLHEDGQIATLRAHFKPSDQAIFQSALNVARFVAGPVRFL